MAASESASRSSSAADSYIGSLISLTSKSEIRYEGVLYNINTEESSIGLRNVRSFGTEGRKKDGPQIAPSDKIYEYILFRGSDIKDLQVKSAPPVQPPQPVQQINNDPAIIQSHYARPVAASPSLTSSVSGPLPDIGNQPAPPGLPGPNLQGGIPLYQPPGANLGSWGASPPPPGTNGGGGVQMPMYWPGYYSPAGALPQMHHQQSLLRPPPGLSMPSMPVPYPTFNPPLPSGPPNFPELPPSLATAITSSTDATTTTTNSATLTSTSLAPSTLPSAIPALPPTLLSSDQPLPSSIPNKAPSLSPLTTASTALDTTSSLLPLSNKPIMVPGQTLAYLSVSQSTSSVVGLSSSVGPDTTAPLLVTPGQLLQSTAATPAVSSTSLQAVHKDVEVVKAPASSSEGLMPVPAEAQPPILPLPPPTRALPKNGAPFNNRHGSYRGRGRGAGSSHSVTKFSEDFDFTAMNEKFNKDEVWGHLGKKSHPKDKEDDGEISDEDDAQNEDDAALSNFDVEQPVYNKDDFFDSLSSNALDSNSHRGRTRYSEQMKIDTETFGDFPRYRGGGRGGRGFARGGRGRGGGYYGGGYGGYNGRGRGRGMNSRGQ